MAVFVLLALVFLVALLAMSDATFFRPIGCPRCGDPLIEHLQEQVPMPDYCPRCGHRL